MSLGFEKALIIGAGGFIGTNLCHYFDLNNQSYIAISRDDRDLRDQQICLELFRALPKFDRIFHLATFQRTGAIQYEIPADLLVNNARIHLNILENWARFHPEAKLISTGSSCAYPEKEGPISENLFMGGPLAEYVRSYGLAKQLLAHGSEAYANQHGLTYLHCILATVYGPHDHVESDRSHFVGGMLHRAIEDQRNGSRIFRVYGHPDTTRECLYVVDQIEAILAADQYFKNCVLNCTAGQPVTLDDVAHAIIDSLDWEADISYSLEDFSGVRRKVLDSGKFLKVTGWRPSLSLETGIKRYVDELTAYD
jgi:GDP-L-fucose synthase